jgi:hypothetical protein
MTGLGPGHLGDQNWSRMTRTRIEFYELQSKLVSNSSADIDSKFRNEQIVE